MRLSEKPARGSIPQKILEIEPTRDAIHGEPYVASSSLAELWRAWRIES